MVYVGEEWQSINAHKTLHQYEIHLFKSMSKKKKNQNTHYFKNKSKASQTLCLKCSTKPWSRTKKKNKNEIFDTSRLLTWQMKCQGLTIVYWFSGYRRRSHLGITDLISSFSCSGTKRLIFIPD